MLQVFTKFICQTYVSAKGEQTSQVRTSSVDVLLAFVGYFLNPSKTELTALAHIALGAAVCHPFIAINIDPFTYRQTDRQTDRRTDYNLFPVVWPAR